MASFTRIVSTLIFVAQSIACSVIFYFFVRKYHDYKNSNRRSLKLSKTFHMLCILGSLCMISFILTFLFVGFTNLVDDESAQKILHVFDILFILLWIIFLFTFEILRLKTTFDDTIYQIKPKTIIILTLIIFSAAIVGFVQQLLPSSVLDDELAANIFLVIALCSSLAVSIVISSMFATKLFHLMLMQRNSKCFIINKGSNGSSNSDSNMNGISDNLIDLTQRQRTLLTTITKQTVLSCFQSVSFFMGILYIALIQTNVLFDGNNKNKSYSASYTFSRLFCFFIVGIFNVIPSLCIWFSFAFAKKEYYTVCNKCDVCFMNWYEETAIKSIAKRSQQDTESDYGKYELVNQT